MNIDTEPRGLASAPAARVVSVSTISADHRRAAREATLRDEKRLKALREGSELESQHSRDSAQLQSRGAARPGGNRIQGGRRQLRRRSANEESLQSGVNAGRGQVPGHASGSDVSSVASQDPRDVDNSDWAVQNARVGAARDDHSDSAPPGRVSFQGRFQAPPHNGPEGDPAPRQYQQQHPQDDLELGVDGNSDPAGAPNGNPGGGGRGWNRNAVVQAKQAVSGYSLTCIGAGGCGLLVIVVLAFIGFSLFARDVMYQSTDDSSVGIGLFTAGAVIVVPCLACLVSPCIGCCLCCQASIDSQDGRAGLLDASVAQIVAALWVSLVAIVGPLLLIVPRLVLHPRNTGDEDIEWQYTLWSLFLAEAVGWIPLYSLVAEAAGVAHATGLVWLCIAFTLPMGVFIPPLVLGSINQLGGQLAIAACIVLSFPAAYITEKLARATATRFQLHAGGGVHGVLFGSTGGQGAGAGKMTRRHSSSDETGPKQGSRMPDATNSEEERELDLCCGTCCFGYGALFVAREQRIQRRVDAQQTVIAVSSPSRPVQSSGAAAVITSPLRSLHQTSAAGCFTEEDLNSVPPHRRLAMRARHLGEAVARSGTSRGIAVGESRRAKMLARRHGDTGTSGGDTGEDSKGEGREGTGSKLGDGELSRANPMAGAGHALKLMDHGLGEQMRFLTFCLDSEHPLAKRPPGLFESVGLGIGGSGGDGQSGGKGMGSGAAGSQLDDHDGTIGLSKSSTAAGNALLQSLLSRPKVPSAKECMEKVRVALAEAGAMADEVQETIENHPESVRFVARELRNAVVGATRACCAAALGLLRGFDPEECASWLDRAHPRMLELVEQLGAISGATDDAIGAALLDQIEDAIEAAAAAEEHEDEHEFAVPEQEVGNSRAPSVSPEMSGRDSHFGGMQSGAVQPQPASEYDHRRRPPPVAPKALPRASKQDALHARMLKTYSRLHGGALPAGAVVDTTGVSMGQSAAQSTDQQLQSRNTLMQIIGNDSIDHVVDEPESDSAGESL